MGVVDALGGNSTTVDAAEAERDQRSKYPLLFHKDERVEMAFQVKGFGRDKSFLTTHRMLLKDGKGVGNKRKNYVSIPYDSIQAFSVETAGSLDGDTELKVWTSSGVTQKIEFSKKEVDLWIVQQFMNAKMDWSVELDSPSTVVANHPISLNNNNATPKKVGVWDWLGGNAHAMDPQAAEQQLKNTTPLLLEDEKVEMAFSERRDKLFFTSHRLLVANMQGITGKRVEFVSYPWRFIRGFSVRTAGSFLDVDSELKIYTNIRQRGCLYQDFRHNKVDLMAIQRYLSDRVLGKDATPLQAGLDRREGHVDPKGNFWFRDNQRPLDAVEMDSYYHHAVPILQPHEHVEFAFKGRRDVTLFTTKRILDIDPMGFTGQRIEYTTFPWSSVLAFGARTQGKFLDNDAEVMVWTDMMFFPGSGEDDPPQPGMSFLEIDFNPKLTNVLRLKQYLAKRLLSQGNKDDQVVPIDPSAYALAPTNDGKDNVVDWIGDNKREINPRDLEDKLRQGENIMLLEEERVIMAFKAGRDITIFTNLRILYHDVRGMSGAKVQYTSIPYSSIRGFKAESAGGWDRDAELDLYTRNLWTLRKLEMDFRKGKADIIGIQRFLAAIVLGTKEDATRYLSQARPVTTKANPASVNHFMSWMTGNSKTEDAEAINSQFHQDPAILLTNEKVERAFRKGRDLYLYTTHRVLVVDVQGMRGKKVEYKSIPLKWIRTFEVETAGYMDRDAEVYVKADIAEGKVVKQSILVKEQDIYESHSYLAQKLLFSNPVPKVEDEPEFVFEY